jgi:hypothetical protein
MKIERQVNKKRVKRALERDKVNCKRTRSGKVVKRR